MENKNMNNLNDPNHNKKGRKTKTGVAIALLLTGFVIGGTVLVNNGKGQTTVSPQKVGVGEVVAEEFKYKGEDEGSILNIQEELEKIDREETEKRQEEFNKQLAEDKVEEEQQLEEVQDTEQQVVEVHQEEVQQGETTQQQGKGATEQQATSNTSSNTSSNTGSNSGSGNTSSNSGGGQSTQKSTPKQSKPKAQAPKQNTQAPKQNTNINNDENVDPNDVYGHLYEEEHVIPYKTVYVENPLLEEGQENVLLEGVNGTEVHVYDVTILGGGDYQRTLNYKFMSQNPIDRIVEVRQKP